MSSHGNGAWIYTSKTLHALAGIQNTPARAAPAVWGPYWGALSFRNILACGPAAAENTAAGGHCGFLRHLHAVAIEAGVCPQGLKTHLLLKRREVL